MKSKKLRTAGLFAGMVFSMTMISCEKEQVGLVSDQDSKEEQILDEGEGEITLDLSGTWIWESTQTSSTIITAADIEFSKEIYFKEDKVYFYEAGKITTSKTYSLHKGISDFGGEAVILVMQGDAFTYEVTISEQRILTITDKDCLDRTIKKYRKK